MRPRRRSHSASDSGYVPARVVDVRGSNPSDLTTSLDLGGLGGAARSALVAADSLGVDVGDGAVGLEVSRLPDRRPLRRARKVRESV